jgi:hypothetical protein
MNTKHFQNARAFVEFSRVLWLAFVLFEAFVIIPLRISIQNEKKNPSLHVFPAQRVLSFNSIKIKKNLYGLKCSLKLNKTQLKLKN